jgi:FtsP/CotA-like multicopper oxidase with cupredoxin domain
MKFLKSLLLGVAGIVLVLFVFVLVALARQQFRTTEFVNEQLVLQNRLWIPPQLEPRLENGEKVFDLTIQSGASEFFEGKRTRTWGFNGNYLGPTLRARTGDKVRLRVNNQLDETTTVHWHGMHLPAAMDGGPHQLIKPGETWEPYWTITNQAATLWYHSHQMEKTGVHVYRGLAGMFIIDDQASDSLDLPKTYGVDDIPLVVQDRKFDDNGQLVYDHDPNDTTGPGMLGNTILVNGTYAPYVELPAKLVRLRILNASNARRYNFGLADNRTFYQIATDGGLLEQPVERTRMVLAPGERAEILVDLSDTRIPLTLMSYPVVNDVNAILNSVFGLFVPKNDEHAQFKLLELRPTAGNFAKQELLKTLYAVKPFDESAAVRTRQFTLDPFARINDKRMDHARVDEIVIQGDIEIWEIRNLSSLYHPFHIHGVQFRVLDRNGNEPPAYERGWKDTVIVNQLETVRVIMQFEEYSDPNLPYMFHCHNLEHEDMGMMGQFVVVDDPSAEVQIQSRLMEAPTQKHIQH